VQHEGKWREKRVASGRNKPSNEPTTPGPMQMLQLQQLLMLLLQFLNAAAHQFTERHTGCKSCNENAKLCIIYGNQFRVNINTVAMQKDTKPGTES